jgi:hypothetical protein
MVMSKIFFGVHMAPMAWDVDGTGVVGVGDGVADGLLVLIDRSVLY